MMSSRGMGDINPSKKPGASKKTRQDYAEGGQVWDKPNPAKKHKKLSPAKKSMAKAAAKAAGRSYPNLVDNMRMARKK